MDRTAILHNARKTVSAFFLFIAGSTGLFAQEGTATITPPRQMASGAVLLATDYRSTNRSFAGSNGSATDGSVFLQAEFSWGRVPFDLSLSTRKDIYGKNYLRYGLHPELHDGRLRFHAGDFYTDSPELTFGRTSIFGLGAQIQLGNFRTSASYGEVEKPYSWSESADNPDNSGRKGLELGIGFGNETGGFVDIRFSRIADDSTSAAAAGTNAQENTAIATRFVLPLFENRLRIEGEGSIAAWSSDLAAARLDEETPIPEAIFTPRVSSQADAAGRIGLTWAPSYDVAFRLNGSWIGPGYISLAQPYMLNDLFEASLSPTLSLFTGRLYLNGSIGIEWDNLRGTKEGRTDRLIGSAYATAYATDWLTLNLSYNNYGARSDHANDTARYGYVSRSLNVSPTVYWKGLGGANTGSIGVAVQSGKTRNPGGDFSHTSVGCVDGSWSLALPSSLSLTTRFGYSRTESESYGFETLSADETISHTILKGRLTGSITLGLSRYLNAEGGTNLNFSTTAFYNLNDFGRISLVLSNSYDEGFGSNASATHELYGALRYGVNF